VTVGTGGAGGAKGNIYTYDGQPGTTGLVVIEY
jgi:hypothetical protein